MNLKKFLSVVLALAVFAGCAAACGQKQTDDAQLVKLTVSEVTHSIFYAPMYAADSLGYFEEEGFDIDIILTSGADAVAAAVMSGDAEVGFCGSEQSIYIYNGGEKNYLVNFAGLTKRDGSFIVSRTKEKFDIKDLKGQGIIVD